MAEKGKLPKGMTPFNTMDAKKMKEIATKGGKSVSGPKASIAAKLTWLRRKGKKLNESQINFLDQLLIDPNASLLNIANFIEDNKHLMDPQDYIKLSQNQHKLVHGEKKRLDINMIGNVSINFGVDMSKFNPEKIIDAEIEEDEE